MSLDAFVFCDCFEKGRLKHPPPDPQLVYVLPNGDLDCRTQSAGKRDAFDSWRQSACRHEAGMVAGDCLGSICSVDALSEALRPHARKFPVLLKKVIYSGSHCGDHLRVKDVEKLKAELTQLKKFRPRDPDLARELREFVRSLQKIVRASLRIRKPIAC